MAELEEQAAEAQEDVQKGCFGSILSFMAIMVLGVVFVLIVSSLI